MTTASTTVPRMRQRIVSQRSRLREGWSAKESVLNRFLTLDKRIPYNGSIPLLVRCVLAKSTIFGVIGSLSYVIGAAIRGDNYYPNWLVIFTGGIVVGGSGGILLYSLPSFSYSPSMQVITQALILQIFILSILVFVSIPAVGSNLMDARNTWEDMLVDQLIGVAFVLIILCIALFIYRRQKWGKSASMEGSVLLREGTDQIHQIELNPIAEPPITIRETQLATSPTNKHDKGKDSHGNKRALPFLSRKTSQNSSS